MKSSTPPISGQPERLVPDADELKGEPQVPRFRYPEKLLVETPVLGASTCYVYGTPVPTMFLWEVMSLSDLAHESAWVARDGLVPLLWFFTRFPRPDAGKYLLYIHWKWRSVIPAEWRERCRLYQLETRDLGAIAKPTRWVTVTIASPAFCSPEHLNEVLAEVDGNPGLDDLRLAGKMQGYIQQRFDVLGPPRSAGSYMLEFLKRLGMSFRGRYELVNPGDIGSLGLLDDALVLDFNERLICSDDFNLHALARRSAIFPVARLPGRETFLKLSHWHGFGIYALPNDTPNIWDNTELMKLRDFLEESYRVLPPNFRHGDHPWPLWVEELGAAIVARAREQFAVRGSFDDFMPKARGRLPGDRTPAQDVPMQVSLRQWAEKSLGK